MSAIDRYALFGHPIRHSRSPTIHAMFAQQCGQQLQYTSIDVLPDALTQSIADFFAAGGKGLNITVPHKEHALRCAAELSERARLAVSVNTLLIGADGRLRGDNTDGVGLERDLQNNLRWQLAGSRVLLLGAGGAARGVLAPLLALRPACLHIVNRTGERALRLTQEFAPYAAQHGVELRLGGTGSYDFVLNATASSLAGTAPPSLPLGALAAHTCCYDMAYGTGDSAFMRLARDMGCRHVSMGVGMLVEQAAESFYLWRGVRPATPAVLQELLRQLASPSG